MPLPERKRNSAVFKEFFVVGVNAYEIHEAKRMNNEVRRSQSNMDSSF